MLEKFFAKIIKFILILISALASTEIINSVFFGFVFSIIKYCHKNPECFSEEFKYKEFVKSFLQSVRVVLVILGVYYGIPSSEYVNDVKKIIIAIIIINEMPYELSLSLVEKLKQKI